MKEQNQIIVKPTEFGLQPKQVKDVDNAFLSKKGEIETAMEVYNSIIKKEITPETAQEARELRLKVVKIKTGIAKIHKTQKEFALAFGKYCDAWKRKETEPVQQMIDKLLEIEKYQERLEQERKEKLRLERQAELEKYITEPVNIDLAEMHEEVWSAYLEKKKAEYEARLEAERKAKQERLERERKEKLHRDRKEQLIEYWQFVEPEFKEMDLSELSEADFSNVLKSVKKEKLEYEKEQERLRKEAERLRKEKAEAEAKAKAEAERLRKKQEAERKKREAEERKRRDEYEAKLKKEREEKERIEAELRAKKEAELRAKKEAELQRQKELAKGDSEKFKDLMNDLEMLKSKYAFKSEEYQKKYSDIKMLIEKIIKFSK